MYDERDLGVLQDFLLKRLAAQAREHRHVSSETETGSDMCRAPEFGSCRPQLDAEAKVRFISECKISPAGASLNPAAANQKTAAYVYVTALRLMANTYSDHPDYEKVWGI